MSNLKQLLIYHDTIAYAGLAISSLSLFILNYKTQTLSWNFKVNKLDFLIKLLVLDHNL